MSYQLVEYFICFLICRFAYQFFLDFADFYFFVEDLADGVVAAVPGRSLSVGVLVIQNLGCGRSVNLVYRIVFGYRSFEIGACMLELLSVRSSEDRSPRAMGRQLLLGVFFHDA